MSSAASRLTQITAHMSSNNQQQSAFTANIVPQAASDPLFALDQQYRDDPDNKKVNLGIGAYRDDNAKPWILPVVKKAEEILNKDPSINHEYLPIAGLAEFRTASQNLVFGQGSRAIADKRVTSLQTISGTGAVHLGALFLSKFYRPVPNSSEPPLVYLSAPTWPNHHQIFNTVNVPIKTYTYFNPQTKRLDFDSMKHALQTAPQGSIVVLHACAHNPTGSDPTREQWKEIADLMSRNRLFPFFDTAYQGFASGNLAEDAWAIRYFVEQGFELVVAQSYAKNLGLYGERVGCFHFVTSPSPQASETCNRVFSQLAILQRSEISNPPAYGARLATKILTDPTLFAEWEANLREMSGRIIDMRNALSNKLKELGTPGTWNHITDQIGMFSFTGLNESQVLRIRKDAHVYLTTNGRISMAGLNTKNVEHVARAIDAAVRAG